MSAGNSDLEDFKRFAFGAQTRAEAIEQVERAPMPARLRTFLLESLGNPTLEILGARHAQVTHELNTKFDAQHIEATIEVLRCKFGENLDGYEFSGFVAPAGGDPDNPYFPDPKESTPEQFRQDAAEFATEEKCQFKAAMQENCAVMFNGKPGLGWPMAFFICVKVSEDEKGAHLYIQKDQTQQIWYGKALCFVPPRKEDESDRPLRTR